MNNANVISVNPGIKTMGELNIEEITLSRISRTISNPGQKSSTFKHILNATFGINSDVTSRWSAKLASIRVAAGSIMLALGAFSLQGAQAGMAPQALGIVSIALGVSLILGLFTRLISIGALGVAIAIAFESISGGALDSTALTVALSGIIMGILGPGHYSLDQIMRKGLYTLYRNRNRHDPDRDPSRIAFDYSAFASVDTRLR